MSDHVPTPYILDVDVLTEISRGDADLIGLVQDYDRAGQPLVISALAATGALLDAPGEDAEALLSGLSGFEHVQIAALDGVEQANLLANMISRTGLNPWRAHVASLADMAACPIITLDRSQWEQHAGALDDPLYFIVIADPDQ
ncbi:hypothetical protein GCM10010412_097770 [Nonomuraea recticatena]|uniref:PIN domain-containing protein n=1 Tax=Nonomuraea recticatena TaxID=46178 RepID=A0ABN3TCS4_9ACTN